MDPLFAAYPHLAAAIDGLVELPPWRLTGASALIRTPRGLLFELTKPKHWRRDPDGVTVIGLGAIGGSLERGETVLDCLRREAQEELRTGIALHAARESVLVYEEREVVRVAASDRPRDYPLPALFTVSENLYRRRRHPTYRTLAIATFWAELADAGTPADERALGDLYGTLTIPEEHLRAVLAGPHTALDELLRLPGVRIAAREPLPERVVLEPVWTVRSVQLALQAGGLPGIRA